MERILALDPGGTTGWASWSDYDDPSVRQFDCGQIGPEEHHGELWKLMERFYGWSSDLTIVTERFEYRNQSRAGLNLMSREYIGVAKLFDQKSHSTLVLQTAAQAKGFVKDDHIKRLGLWVPGDKHAMDAYRHLLYYIINVSALPIRNKILEVGWK